MVTFAEAANSAMRASLALTFSYMLLYLVASLPSVSLDPPQSPFGGALAQQLRALLSLHWGCLTSVLPPGPGNPPGMVKRSDEN